MLTVLHSSSSVRHARGARGGHARRPMTHKLRYHAVATPLRSLRASYPSPLRALPLILSDPVAATGLNPVVLATFVVWTGGVGVGTVVLRQREEKARQLLADAKIDVSDIPDGSWGKVRMKQRHATKTCAHMRNATQQLVVLTLGYSAFHTLFHTQNTQIKAICDENGINYN